MMRPMICLLVACWYRSTSLRQPASQMQITARGGDQQGMASGIMQQHQRGASLDRPGAPDETTWDQVFAVNRLAMSINVDGECPLCGWSRCLPQGGREACECIGERLSPTSPDHLGEEPLHMAIPYARGRPLRLPGLNAQGFWCSFHAC
jgi:hypothetical protein